MTPLFVLSALIGCVPDELPIGPPIGEFIEDAYEVQGFEAASAVGNAPLGVTVRAVNRFGASIPSEPQGILVDGASQTVGFDAVGYGTVRLTSPGTFDIDDGGSVVQAQVLDATWPGFGISRAFEPASGVPSHAVAITTGAVISAGSELFWVGPESEPHRVLNADSQIRGLQAGHIDVDGVLDVVAWTEQNVYLMRGRLNGGLAFGAAVTADRHRVGGAAIGELSQDNLPDLVIAWTTDDGPSQLDEWHGNGLFGFNAAEPRNLPAIPVSVSIGDTTGEGRNQITVLTEDGNWARFIAGSDVRYMPIGPNTPDQIDIPLGSTVEATGDINGDGGDEMWFLGPLNPGSERRMVLVDLVGNKIEFLNLGFQGAQFGRADLDGDGLADHVALLETNELRSLSFDQTSSNSYTPRSLDNLPDFGPIATDDVVDKNGVPDLFLAGSDLWWWWRGANNPASSDVFWSVGEQAMGDAGSVTGPIRILERDGDPQTSEIFTFGDQNGNTTLDVWSWDTVTQTGTLLGSEVVSSTGVDPVDLAICGDRAIVLLESRLARVNIANLSNPGVTLNQPSTAIAVDCGTAPSGGDVALLDGGAVDILDFDFNLITSLPAGGAQDVAIGDVGAGPEVRTCDTANCSVVYWDAIGIDGAFATSNAASISLDGIGAQVISGNGALSVYDVDGDGGTDLVALNGDGVVTVHRSNGESVGFPEIFHTRNAPMGAAAIGDADGDGEPDLWIHDANNRLLYSVAPAFPVDGTTGSGSGTTP